MVRASPSKECAGTHRACGELPLTTDTDQEKILQITYLAKDSSRIFIKNSQNNSTITQFKHEQKTQMLDKREYTDGK